MKYMNTGGFHHLFISALWKVIVTIVVDSFMK